MREGFSGDPPGKDATAIIRRFAAGEAELIGWLHHAFRRDMIRAAKPCSTAITSTGPSTPSLAWSIAL